MIHHLEVSSSVIPNADISGLNNQITAMTLSGDNIPAISDESPHPLNALPVELLHPIIVILADSHRFASLFALARTCKKFYILALPAIYEDVYLDSVDTYKTLLKCLHTPNSGSGNDINAGRTVHTHRLIENFRMTKRVTLGDLPNGDYCRQLRDVVKVRNDEEGRHNNESLFPNARFSKIFPVNPYPLGKRDQSYTFHSTTPQFLSLAIHPEHVCLHDLYGSPGDQPPSFDTSRSSFADYLMSCHLTEKTWGDRQSPGLSWHGTFANLLEVDWYDNSAYKEYRRLVMVRPSWRFKRVNLYMTTDINTSAHKYGGLCPRIYSAHDVMGVEEIFKRSMLQVFAEEVNLRLVELLPGQSPQFVVNFEVQEPAVEGTPRIRPRPVFTKDFRTPTSRANTVHAAPSCLSLVTTFDQRHLMKEFLAEVQAAILKLENLQEQVPHPFITSWPPLGPGEQLKWDSKVCETLTVVDRLVDEAVGSTEGLSGDRLIGVFDKFLNGVTRGSRSFWETDLPCGEYGVPPEDKTRKSIEFDVRIGADQNPCPVCKLIVLDTTKENTIDERDTLFVLLSMAANVWQVVFEG